MIFISIIKVKKTNSIMDKFKNFLKAVETKIVGWITPIAEKCNMEVDKMLHQFYHFHKG